MEHFKRQELVELQPATEAISHKDFRVHFFYFTYQSASELDGGLVKILLEPHDTGQPATIVDRYRRNRAQNQQPKSLPGRSEADGLRSHVEISPFKRRS
jgi:hypothetical protein